MKRTLLLVAVVLFSATTLSAQFASERGDYKITKRDVARARAVVETPLPAPLVIPNPASGAQWFPEASLGLFMHWGIHSVVGAQPSWDMISNYRWGGRVAPPERYYALADEFNPQQYDPRRYLKAAKEAGFRYAVLTTKHHDGYTLWPSRYGIGVQNYLEGRDLLGEYVEACRELGLKVGFYFSPRDWHYPGLMHPREFDANTRNDIPPVTDSAAAYERYLKFLGYTLTQMEELLTRYGKIDLLWLDGMHFAGVEDMHTEQVYSWIRSLQPDILINDRWANIVNPDNPSGTAMRVGDFTTPFETILPTYVPSKQWDHCDILTSGKNGGWGYDTTGYMRPYSWFFEHLVATRSLGGNFLLNISPSGGGDMHPNYYTYLDGLAQWMRHSGESLIGAEASSGAERSNVKITTDEGVWYLHLLPDFKAQVSLKCDQHPRSITLLRTGEEIPYIYLDGFVNFTLSEGQRTEMDDVVKVQF